MMRWAKLSTRIGQDGRVARLAETDAFAALLYTWSLAAADVYGLVPADPREYKAKVCPALDVPLDRIEAALRAQEAAGLVEIYEAGGQKICYVRSYHREQSVRWARVGPPEYPLPGDWAVPRELVEWLGDARSRAAGQTPGYYGLRDGASCGPGEPVVSTARSGSAEVGADGAGVPDAGHPRDETQDSRTTPNDSRTTPGLARSGTAEVGAGGAPTADQQRPRDKTRDSRTTPDDSRTTPDNSRTTPNDSSPDIQSTEVQSTEVQSTEVQSTEVQSTEVQSTDVRPLGVRIKAVQGQGLPSTHGESTILGPDNGTRATEMANNTTAQAERGSAGGNGGRPKKSSYRAIGSATARLPWRAPLRDRWRTDLIAAIEHRDHWLQSEEQAVRLLGEYPPLPEEQHIPAKWLERVARVQRLAQQQAEREHYGRAKREEQSRLVLAAAIGHARTLLQEWPVGQVRAIMREQYSAETIRRALDAIGAKDDGGPAEAPTPTVSAVPGGVAANKGENSDGETAT